MASELNDFTVAIISDVHSNLVALEAVLADIKARGTDAIVCLGDTIGYGPKPRECLELVREHCAVVVKGNHEMALESSWYRQRMNDEALSAIWITKALLSREQLDYCAGLPTRHAGLVERLCLAHGSYAQNSCTRYVYEKDEAAEESRRVERGSIVCLGHSHVPMMHWPETGDYSRGRLDGYFRPGHGATVSVGSVGQPRDGKRQACYTRLGFRRNGWIRIRHVSVPYNVKATVDQVFSSVFARESGSRLYFAY